MSVVYVVIIALMLIGCTVRNSKVVINICILSMLAIIAGNSTLICILLSSLLK